MSWSRAIVAACLLWPWSAAADGPPSGQAGPEPELLTFAGLRVVVIDPGHGGDNRGCLGLDGTYEKDVTLVIARRVQRLLLEETTAVPLLTRLGDASLGLSERARLANRWGADAFVSVHLNADPRGSGRGVETWFLSADAADSEAARMVHFEEAAYGDSPGIEAAAEDAVSEVLRDAQLRTAQSNSEALAASILHALHGATGLAQRGVKQAPFGVLREAEMPAVVVECGFFTHPTEGPRLLQADVQEAIARGIVAGLRRYDARIGGPPSAP